MTDPKEKPESGQNKPETSGPDFDVAPPDIEYVQNDYNPDLDKRGEVLNEKKDK